MSQMTRFAPTGGILMALCVAFAGCAARTDVSGTGSTPAQFTHVFITAQSVWFNQAAGATADDSGWSRFDLKTPVTIDLVAQSNGTLGEIANDLRLAPGTYNSILVLPVNPDLNVVPLTTSASGAGAQFNQEADFSDASGGHTVPLIIPNWEKGIVVSGSVKVPIGKPSAGVGIGVGTNGTTNSARTLSNSPTTVNPVSPATGTGTNNTVTASFAVNFDANRDLHLFNYPATGSSAPQAGVILSSSAAASDLSTAGGITGTISLTTITNDSTHLPSIANAFSTRTSIWASAELLSTDGTHHVIVASAPVGSDGTFTIYPLPSNSSNPTVYDVVIHGPNIETMIIKSVSVATTTPSFQFGANTAGAVNTTTATGAVSLGTLTPVATTNFTVSLEPTTTTNAMKLPGGAALTFYQTLPGNPAPYAIDEVGIDPVNFALVTHEALSTGVNAATGTPVGIASGTFGTNGATITLTSATPAEGGAGTYDVGATAPLYADSVPTTGSMTVSPPAAAAATTCQSGSEPGSTTTTGTAAALPCTVIPAVPTLTPANGAASGTLTVKVQNTQGNDRGALLVTRNGAIVGIANLQSALANGGSDSVVVPNLPSGNYSLSAILWSSIQTPNTPVTYESIATSAPVTLSGDTTATAPIN